MRAQIPTCRFSTQRPRDGEHDGGGGGNVDPRAHTEQLPGAWVKACYARPFSSFVLEIAVLRSATQRMMESNYSNGIERDEEQLARNDHDPTKWTNPLEVRYVCPVVLHCTY